MNYLSLNFNHKKMERDNIIGLSIAFLTLVFIFMQNTKKTDEEVTKNINKNPKTQFIALQGTPSIDGNPTDAIWEQSGWEPLNKIWLGKTPTSTDFNGQYKVAYDENFLYILAQIEDDTLIDIHPDGLKTYWDDDCLEVFVDEDASGGNHQFSHNAFAYHIALDGKVVDINPKQAFTYYNDHCTTRRITKGKTTIWETAIKIFDDTYKDGELNIPKMLKSGKKIGFALAYCDNDYSLERENFIGNLEVEGTDKNRGYIDADIFGILNLQ
jgi:hypothetical protein